MKKGLIIALAIFGGLVVVCGIGGVVALYMIGTSAGLPQGVTMNVELPQRVNVGDSFEIHVKIINADSTAHELIDVDLSERLLAGCTIMDTQPFPRESLTSFGFVTYSYNRNLAPSDEFEFILTLQADAPGVYTGDVSIYIDSIFGAGIHTSGFIIDEAADP